MLRTSSAKIHERQRHTLKQMKRILGSVRILMDEQLRPCGATAAQIRLLVAIGNAPGSSGAQLARLCEITPQTAQVLIQRAEEAGWILRAKDSINGRIVTASLTRQGKDLLSTADELMKGIEARLWKRIPAQELEALNATLDHCLGNITTE